MLPEIQEALNLSLGSHLCECKYVEHLSIHTVHKESE